MLTDSFEVNRTVASKKGAPDAAHRFALSASDCAYTASILNKWNKADATKKKSGFKLYIYIYSLINAAIRIAVSPAGQTRAVGFAPGIKAKAARVAFAVIFAYAALAASGGQAKAAMTGLSNSLDPTTSPATTTVNVTFSPAPVNSDLFVDILDPNNLQGWGVNAIVRHLFINRVSADQAIPFNLQDDRNILLPAGSYQAKAYNAMSAVYDMKIQGTGLEFDDPRDTAIDVDGNIYVVSYNNGCIMKFNSLGVMLLKFGCSNMTDVIYRPRGIAVGATGTIYISASDGTNYRIERWSSTGTVEDRSYITGTNVATAQGLGIDRGVAPERLYIASCSNTGTRSNYLCRYNTTTQAYIDTYNAAAATVYDVDVVQGGGDIYYTRNDFFYRITNALVAGCNIDTGTSPVTGVTVDSTGTNIYMSSPGNDRIQKRTSACALTQSFGSIGSGSSEFLNPYGIAVAVSTDGNNNMIYITDSGNNRIKVIADPLPNPIFSTPTDTAIDASGNIYQANSGNGCIQKFNSAGTYQSKFGCGTISTPRGVAVDSSGNIYVAANNAGNYRIEKYDSTGTAVSTSYITGANVASAQGLDIDRGTTPNYLYIASCGDAGTRTWQACRYDLSTGLFVDDYTPSGAATVYDVAVAQGGGNIFVTRDDYLYVTNNSWTAIGNIDTGTTPARGVAAAGNSAYVTSQGNDRICKYYEMNNALYYATTTPCFGTVGTGTGNFTDPWGVAYNPTTGVAYVADSSAAAPTNRIKLVTETQPSKEILSPSDTAVDATGSLYVANSGNGCVQKLNATTGALQMEIGCNYFASNTIDTPLGVAVDSAGNIYVAALSAATYRIEKWNSDGTPNNRNYITGANAANAKGLGIDRGTTPNYLYIAGCAGANNYCRYNLTTGAYVDTYSPAAATAYDIDVVQGGGDIYAISADTLYRVSNAWAAGCSVDTGSGSVARGVTVTAGGVAYITNQDDDRIRKYNSSCALLNTFGSAGAGNDQFSNPMGIAVNSAATSLFVGDTGNNRIKVVTEY